MKKITETAKELGITFCQDCAQYSWEYCDKFGDHVDPGDLSCPHFLPSCVYAKLKREIENVAFACGFVTEFGDDFGNETISVTFIKKGVPIDKEEKETDVDKFLKGCEGCTETWCFGCSGGDKKHE